MTSERKKAADEDMESGDDWDTPVDEPEAGGDDDATWGDADAAAGTDVVEKKVCPGRLGIRVLILFATADRTSGLC